MSSANKPRAQDTPVQPNLSSLVARYLQRQSEAHAQGLAAADSGGDVFPYEAGPVQPIDAKPAWEEAIAVAKYYGVADARVLQAPPHWPQLVSASEPATALPFCLGNFPQLVRNFQALLQAKSLAELRPTGGRPVQAPALVDWARAASTAKQFPKVLLALGALRLANQFQAAHEIVGAGDGEVPAPWRAAWVNEKAALAWQSGKCEEALAMWKTMPPSVPVSFNLGMASLFCGRLGEAGAALQDSVSQLPETGAWHHLGRLYLTLLGERAASAS